ncbi:MAG: alpha/beta hydrolase [Actinomycetota bacterium]
MEYRERPATREPQGVMILFHGRGADQHDLFPLFDLLDPAGRLFGFAPRGPLALPPGGAHWYVSRDVGHPDPSSFHATVERVDAWLASVEVATGCGRDRTIIGGFSQGAVMSYALGLGRGRPPPRALVALSGFMPVVDDFELDVDDRGDLSVAIGHGTYDPVIDVEWGRLARERLEAAGADVLYRESPMAHGIDPGFVQEIAAWLE